MLHTFLLLLAGAICFFIAVLGSLGVVRSHGVWQPLGLLLWILVPLIAVGQQL